jgi:hypothetical protein
MRVCFNVHNCHLHKEQGKHDAPQNIIAIDSFAFFLLALVTRLGRDEGNEFRNALLDALLGVLGYLGVVRESLLHDARDVGYRQESVS